MAINQNELMAQQRRDRTVRQPGQRGGTWRRIWSDKLQKWYVKYGKDPKTMRIQNAPRRNLRDDPAQDPSPQVASPEQLVAPRQSEAQALLEGIFEKLMEAMQIGQTGTGRMRLGRPVSFGNVSPIRGEMVPEDDETRFYMYDEDGNMIDNPRRRIDKEQKRQEFMAYIVSKFITDEFLRDKYSKSITFLVNTTEKLSKSFTQALLEARLDKAIFPLNPPKFPTSGKLEENIEALQKTVAEFGSQRTTDGSVALPLAKADKWLSRLEKAGNNDVWLRNAPIAGKRYGHVGSGNRSVYRRPGRPPGTGQGLTAASAGFPRSGIGGLGSEQRTDQKADSKSVKTSDEDWYEHPDLKVGSMVLVQHPYRHKKPTWGRVISIGKHGAVVDCDGDRFSIRWEHVHKVTPRVDNSPENVLELARLGLPMSGTDNINFRDEKDAEDALRKLGMPFHSDLIHDRHDDRDEAYAHLFSSGAPIDVIEATRAKPKGDQQSIDKFKGNMVDMAIAQRVPVNPELLRRLPLETVVSILHHHLNEGKNVD